MKPGTILSYTWGYEQTNADFFQVTRATAKTAWIRPIAQTETPDGGFMTGKAKPVINRFTGPERRKRIQRYENSEFLSMDHGVAREYTRPVSVSHYA